MNLHDEKDSRSRSDEELVKAFLAGDREAFEELVRRYQAQIFNLAFRLLGNRQDACDATQEIFILLYKKLGTFREESRFSTWLYRVATNSCKDLARRLRSHISLSERVSEDMPEWGENIPADPKDHPDEMFMGLELQQTVQEAMMKLPLRFRVVLYLSDIEGYNYGEIAKILGISIGTVKSRLNRARLRMARELASSWEPNTLETTSNALVERRRRHQE